MRFARTIPMLALALLAGCSAADRAAHSKLVDLAGPGAIDCGKGATKERLPLVSKCVKLVEDENKPYFVRYLTHGDDSLVTYGLARNAKGELFKLMIDHDPNGGHADPVFKPKGEVAVFKCRDTKSSMHRGMMTCDP